LVFQWTCILNGNLPCEDRVTAAILGYNGAGGTAVVLTDPVLTIPGGRLASSEAAPYTFTVTVGKGGDDSRDEDTSVNIIMLAAPPPGTWCRGRECTDACHYM
jgi:hypothetical protein